MLGYVAEQAYDEVKKAVHGQARMVDMHTHDQVFHEVDDLGEALEVFKGVPRVGLVPVYLRVARLQDRLEHTQVLLLEVVDQAVAGGVQPSLLLLDIPKLAEERAEQLAAILERSRSVDEELLLQAGPYRGGLSWLESLHGSAGGLVCLTYPAVNLPRLVLRVNRSPRASSERVVGLGR